LADAWKSRTTLVVNIAIERPSMKRSHAGWGSRDRVRTVETLPDATPARGVGVAIGIGIAGTRWLGRLGASGRNRAVPVGVGVGVYAARPARRTVGSGSVTLSPEVPTLCPETF